MALLEIVRKHATCEGGEVIGDNQSGCFTDIVPGMSRLD